MKYELKVITYARDLGDGSSSISLYNTEKELRDDFDIEDDEQWERILSQDDPYENGIVSERIIKIEIVDGIAKLDGYCSFSTD